MKKLRTTLFVCLTALAVLTAFGCKQGGEDIGTGKTANWGSQGQLPGQQKTLVLTNDTESIIDWWLVADTEGEVLSYKGKTDNSVIASVSTAGDIQPKEKFTITFSNGFFQKTSRDVVLYISMPTYQPKEKGYVKGKTDYRGTVTIQSGAGVGINASKYAKEVKPIAVYTLQNNEYGKGHAEPTPEGSFSMIKGSWSDNYRITGLTVLKPVDSNVEDFAEGNKFEVVSGINYDFSKNPIEEGKQRSIVITVPETGYYAIGLKQPDRFSEEDKINSETYNTQKNWIFVKKLESTKKHDSITRLSSDYDGKINLDGKDYITAGNKQPVTGRNVAPTLYEFIPAVPGEK